MENTLLFACSTNILVRLPTVNMKTEISYPKNPKICDPILVTIENATPLWSLQSWKYMAPHSAAHHYEPLIRKYPPPGGGQNYTKIIWELSNQTFFVDFWIRKESETSCYMLANRRERGKAFWNIHLMICKIARLLNEAPTSCTVRQLR